MLRLHTDSIHCVRRGRGCLPPASAIFSGDTLVDFFSQHTIDSISGCKYKIGNEWSIQDLHGSKAAQHT